MKLSHHQRLLIAHEIQRQLPWASIAVGAKGHNFLNISRGEVIRGSLKRPDASWWGWQSSAWSRPWPGSYEIQVELTNRNCSLMRHMEARRGEMERMIECKTENIPAFDGVSVPERIKGVADWLVSRAANMPEAPRYDRLLRKGETFDVRRWELSPAMSAGRKAVRG